MMAIVFNAVRMELRRRARRKLLSLDTGHRLVVTARWLDGRKNETRSGSGTTPNTVGLALHFSVGIGGGPEFLRESKYWSGCSGHLAQADSQSFQRVTKVYPSEYHAAVSYLRGARSRLWRGGRTTITIAGTRQ